MHRVVVIFYPRNNYCSLRNNPEERSSHLLRRESLQSRIFSVQFVGKCYEHDLAPLQNSLDISNFLLAIAIKLKTENL